MEITEINILKTKVKELKIKNDATSCTFQSLQLVFYELKSENERLKAEEFERKLRLEVMTKAKDRIREICELNQNLIKFVLEQKAMLNHSNIIRQHHASTLESHINFQKTIQEKMKSLRESHSNMKIVKRHDELNQTIIKLNQEIDQLNKTFKHEERNYETKQENLDQKINRLIIKLAVKALNKIEEPIPEEDKTPETPQLFQSIPLTEISHSPEIIKPPPIILNKLDDFKIPELPVDLQIFKQSPEVNVQGMLSNLKKEMKKGLTSNADSRKRPLTSTMHQTQSQKVSSSRKQFKEPIAHTPVELKTEEYSMLPKNPRIEQIRKMDTVSRKRKLAFDNKCPEFSQCDSPHIQKSGQESSKVNLAVEKREIAKEQDTKKFEADPSFIADAKPKQIPPDKTFKVDLNKKQKLTQITESNKIVVLSNIVIKGASNESKIKEPSVVKAEQNVETNIKTIKTQNEPCTMPKPDDKETSSANTKKVVLEENKFAENKPPSAIIRQPTAVQKTYTNKKQKISATVQNIETKSISIPSNNPKSIRVQSFESEIIDLNSELPSSHVTIDSSSQNSEALQQSGKLSLTESSSDSASFFKDFLTDFNVGSTEPQKGNLKRKGSDDVAPFATEFDFDNFDFSKQMKMDTGGIADDFFGKLDDIPCGEDGSGKGEKIFNFEDFMSFN